jgi:hypothetical protein
MIELVGFVAISKHESITKSGHKLTNRFRTAAATFPDAISPLFQCTSPEVTVKVEDNPPTLATVYEGSGGTFLGSIPLFIHYQMWPARAASAKPDPKVAKRKIVKGNGKLQ